ncbi:MAG: cytochrome c oxidase subunit 3 [Rickettsiales bacterium]
MAKSSAAADHHHKVDHEFHLVDPSPWPLLAALGFLVLAGSAAFNFHGYPYTLTGMLVGLGLLLYVGYRWWKDCVHEAKAHHTSPVRRGLRYGMAFFIISEVMFFFAFFFSFFHSTFLPMEVLDGAWPVSEGAFPAADQKTVGAWGLPLYNTLLLLMSGTTVTWAHASLLRGDKKGLVNGLICTIILGVIFTGVQAYEYAHIYHELFKFEDNNFTANFFMATGFHGLHVIIGTIFLTVCLIRATKDQFDEKHHLGFEFAAWYWHFVDVVWLFLFTFVYVYTGWGHVVAH